jgi:hypothetical protein
MEELLLWNAQGSVSTGRRRKRRGHTKCRREQSNGIDRLEVCESSHD